MDFKELDEIYENIKNKLYSLERAEKNRRRGFDGKAFFLLSESLNYTVKSFVDEINKIQDEILK